MRIVIKVLGVLGTVALGLAGYLVSTDNKALAFKCLMFSMAFYGVDLVLILAEHLSKTPYTPQRLFKRTPRRRLPLKTTVDSTQPLHNPHPPLAPAASTAPKTSQSTENDYKPDDTAIKILAKIEQQICHESELARVLKLEPSQVSDSLRLLKKHEYVRLISPEGRGPYYQITQKGVTRLDQLAYRPDDVDKKIITYLYNGVDCFDRFIAQAAGLDTQETRLRLNKLASNKYVSLPRSKPSKPFAEYRLTDKGIQYAVDNGLRGEETKPSESQPDLAKASKPASKEKLKETYQLLKSFRDNLPNGELHISDMDEYHGLLDSLQSELDTDLSEYRIPPEAIKSRTGLPGTVEYNIFDGPPKPIPLPVTRYIPAEVFRRKLDALISFLNKPVRNIPFPSGHDILDETLTRMLVLIAQPDSDSRAQALAGRLNLHTERVKHYLSKLEQHGYIYSGIPTGRGLRYYLSGKGREFLIERDLI